MKFLRWSTPVAYFRVYGHKGNLLRVPVTITEHNDLIRGEAIPHAFARKYGRVARFPSQQQLVLSDRWHQKRSELDSLLHHCWDQRGAISGRNFLSGSPLDFSTTNTFGFDPSSADFLWVNASNDRSGSGTTIDTITWNSLSLTLQTALSLSGRATRMGHLVGSLNNNQNIVVTNSSINTKPMAMVGSYSGTDQATPVSGVQTFTTAADTNATWTVSSATGDMVCASAICVTSGLATTPGSGTTERLNRSFAGVGTGFMCEEAGGSSVTINETSTSAAWCGYAFSLKAAAAGTTVLAAKRPLLGVGI